MTGHMISFCMGFILDLFIGDPYWLPHPIRVIGWLIEKLEKGIRRTFGKNSSMELMGGAVLVLLVCAITGSAAALLRWCVYKLSFPAGILMDSVLCYQVLAMKCLKVESMKVYHALAQGDRALARKNLSMIVGRDTDMLDERGIIKAAVETVAENTADGVIAPLVYLALGGPVLGLCYKAINTMDSMVGYKNERYLYFGRAAAKLDDMVNFIPARLSAVFMIGASALLGLDYQSAAKIYKRDKSNHASPNSAHTEAVCAGALGIQLAGDAVYFGKKVEKPFIGDDVRTVEMADIKRANKLLFVSGGLCFLFCGIIMMLW